MREILFKAKRIDNGEWVEGFVFDDGFVDSKRMFVGGLVIMDYKGTADDRWDVGTAFYEVEPDTICQYTGLTDKNGNKIWENDVVWYSLDGDSGDDTKAVIRYGKYDNNGNQDCYLGFYVDWQERIQKRRDIGFWVYKRDIEVIGNIFDNPELLKGEC